MGIERERYYFINWDIAIKSQCDLCILFIYLFSIYLSLTNFISPYNQTSLPQTARLVSNIRCDQQHCGMLLSLTSDI